MGHDLVPDEVRNIFKKILLEGGDIYLYNNFEACGICLRIEDIPSAGPNAPWGNIFCFSKEKRIEIYFSKVDWGDRSSLKKLLDVVNHYLQKISSEEFSQKELANEVFSSLESHGLRFDGTKLVRSVPTTPTVPKAPTAETAGGR